MHAFHLLLLATAAFTSSLVSACNPADVSPYRTGMTVPLKSASADHQVTGTVVVMDGCSFAVRNFTLTPGPYMAYWYGADTKPGNRVVSKQIGAYWLYPQAVFALEPSTTWSNIKGMLHIVSEMNKTVIATAQLVEGPGANAAGNKDKDGKTEGGEKAETGGAAVSWSVTSLVGAATMGMGWLLA